jgi:hypothetical protein
MGRVSVDPLVREVVPTACGAARGPLNGSQIGTLPRDSSASAGPIT